MKVGKWGSFEVLISGFEFQRSSNVPTRVFVWDV